ncbi:hypothetical protein BN1708_000800 [Verticillium longisporum]|uniref:Uncharacterized protein n=1 Tax=Verticillium longisporum TaxID=100787 RepID=A0A0G4M8K1_VERLO|nr:hypothetical protein BN1708_000800 [Verticillium longisporum]
MCGPRIQTGALQTEERIVRAENASANGFEALGNFAGGVVVAHVAGVDASTINILFLAYSASRVFYTFVYVVLQEILKRIASLLLCALSHLIRVPDHDCHPVLQGRGYPVHLIRFWDSLVVCAITRLLTVRRRSNCSLFASFCHDSVKKTRDL